MKKLKSGLFFYIFSVVSAFAATYYVDTTKSNSNDGLSEATAWQTISKVQLYSLSPGFSAGDQILFKRGQIHSGSLLFASSGSSGTNNQITIGAYGTGSDPKVASIGRILGSNVASNWQYTGNNIWYMNIVSIGPSRIWLDGIEYVAAPNSSSIGSQYPWYYDMAARKFYLYSTVNPASAYSSVSYPGNGYVLSFQNNSYIVVKDIEILGGNLASVQIAFDSHDITVQACNIKKGKTGIEILAGYLLMGDGFGSYYRRPENIIIDANNIDSAAAYSYNYEFTGIRDGICIEGGAVNCVISNNTIKNWGRANIHLNSNIWREIIGVKIRDNIISAPDISYSHGIVVKANEASGTENIVILGNIINDTTASSVIAASNVIFYNNEIDTVTNSPAYSSASRGTGIGLEIYNSNVFENCDHNVIMGNTIKNCDDVGLRLHSESTDSNFNLFNAILSNEIKYCGTNIQGSGNSHLAGIALEITELSAGKVTRNKIFKNKLSDTVGSYDVYYKGTSYTASGFNQADRDSGNRIYGSN